MINICIFNGDMSRGGGTERITQVLANALGRNERYKIFVLNYTNKTGESYYLLDNQVTMDVLPEGSILKKIKDLYIYSKRNDIDIIINVDVMLGIFSLPVKLLCPRIKIIAWEMFNIHNDIGSRNTRLVRQLSLLFGAYYITQTKGDRDAFIENMRVKCPITYIYNPCTYEQCSTYKQDSKIIVTAGHFFYTKGYDLAVEVAKSVFDKHPDWRWEFYGDGEKLEEIKCLIKKYKMEKNIILCGRTSNITECYKKASIYVMTSRMEGFGLVLTEAKSFGLPTISFDVDFGPREIIEHNVSGYLIKKFDVTAMANCICDLIEDEEKRYLFSQHARDNLGKFSIKTFTEQWTKIIEEIINSRSK